MIGAVELGLLYAVMAVGVYLTFRVLDFPDLTVDGSFTTGAAAAGVLITNGVNPIIATGVGFVAGFIAGIITGLLHTKGKIDGLLAGILTMIGLWSINLRIMGGANIPLLSQDSVFTPLDKIKNDWFVVGLLVVGAVALVMLIVWFLSTDLGLALRATGDNQQMITSFGVSTDFTKTLTLALSNGLVGLCGALIAQFQGFADISMGVGLILVGLASVIVGQAVIPQRRLWLIVGSVALGSVLYRLIIYVALTVGLNPNDMKLITAVLVIAALLLPKLTGRTPKAAGRKVANA
ncbi:MAG: ABC transporter permease [Corynebacterium casei]|uniref:ABC transport system, permease n=1 Tax=Corynebacterium casei LMG S-19264 TaxID=1285583 RepID=A0ABN4CG30_9CORY|nr:ABC transporter permease [Corynebacterium casei]AHI21334.1 ABC transport system, permease [Corynebacterium casei LMG S-19264]SLM89775.1 ABC-type transporter, permease component [Corynebacterium casei]